MDANVPDELTPDRAIALMPELGGRSLDISELKGGITNKLYRLKDDRDGDYVFRLYGAKTEMFIDRDMEMQTMKLLEPFMVSPKVVKYLPEKSVTVIEFIEGYTLKNEDFLKEELWEKIIRPVKTVHESGVSIAKIFDPLTEVKRFYDLLLEINPEYPEFDIVGTIRVLEKLYERADISHDSFVLCHNDLLADNFMLVNDTARFKEPMYLIDWEYAGMNTVYYEIADMFQEVLVPREVERKLLEIYWEHSDMERHVFMTDLFKPFPDIFWFLWSLIQLNVSSIQFDYYTYGKVKYENAQGNIAYVKDNYGLTL